MTLHLIKPTILHIRLHNLIIWKESLQTSIIQKPVTQEDTNLYPLVILRLVWMPFINQLMPSLVSWTRKLPNGGTVKSWSCYRESPQQHCPRTLDLSFPATSPSSPRALWECGIHCHPGRSSQKEPNIRFPGWPWKNKPSEVCWSPFPNLAGEGHCSSPNEQLAWKREESVLPDKWKVRAGRSSESIVGQVTTEQDLHRPKRQGKGRAGSHAPAEETKQGQATKQSVQKLESLTVITWLTGVPGGC